MPQTDIKDIRTTSLGSQASKTSSLPYVVKHYSLVVSIDIAVNNVIMGITDRKDITVIKAISGNNTDLFGFKHFFND
jgi:hypothetical protein